MMSMLYADTDECLLACVLVLFLFVLLCLLQDEGPLLMLLTPLSQINAPECIILRDILRVTIHRHDSKSLCDPIPKDAIF